MLLRMIIDSYSPNTAYTNRVLAMAKGLTENGLEVEAVYVHPASKFEKIQQLPKGMTATYLWEKHPYSNKYLARLYGFLDIVRFRRKLREGDIVLLIGAGQFLPILIKCKNVRFYHERGEHPDVVKVIPHFLQKSYLKACSKLSGMFVISTELKKYYENLGAKNVTIINMIVDDKRFFSIGKTTCKDKYLVYCGKATNNKDGVDELIKAFYIVNKHYPQIKLYIVGTPPKGNDESGNMHLVEELGLKNDIVFLGEKPADVVPQLLKNAYACVLDRPDSLQAQYGFPTKLGEYLLSGNPVVVTKVGDIPLFLEHKKTALLAEERNPEDFANQVCWLIENPEKANIIGEKGRRLALKEFNYLYETRKIVDAIFNK